MPLFFCTLAARTHSSILQKILMQTTVESPSALCYRHRGLMKTDRQLGSKAQHSSKHALGLTRGLRRASVPRPPTPADFLIANLELEFSSTHRKRSPLRIPNRKFSRVFRSDFSNLTITSSSRSGSAPSNSTLLPVRSSPGCQPPTTAFLIYGSAIKSPANPQGFNNVQFSNRR
jgi:hypothetical protein